MYRWYNVMRTAFYLHLQAFSWKPLSLSNYEKHNLRTQSKGHSAKHWPVHINVKVIKNNKKSEKLLQPREAQEDMMTS